MDGERCRGIAAIALYLVRREVELAREMLIWLC